MGYITEIVTEKKSFQKEKDHQDSARGLATIESVPIRIFSHHMRFSTVCPIYREPIGTDLHIKRASQLELKQKILLLSVTVTQKN